MGNRSELLQKLDNSKLIDAVKNYRQYGYDDALRNEAIRILESRGISVEDLKKTGNFTSQDYESAEGYYMAYQRYSTWAIACFALFIASIALCSGTREGGMFTVAVIAKLITGIAFPAFIIIAAVNQKNFYKVLGKDFETSIALFYTIFFPFYFLLFLFYRSQMKEEMRMIK